jgi:outer membrane protein
MNNKGAVMKISKRIIPVAVCVLVLSFAASKVFSDEAGKGSLELTASDAVDMSLENNKSLRIQRLNPSISKSKEEQQKAVFDPSLTGSVSSSLSEDASDSKSRKTTGSVDISKTLESGTEITLGLSTNNSNALNSGDLYSSRIAVSLSQPLFAGAGSEVNLVGLRQAELATRTSFYELQAYSESIVEQVIATYWDYALAQRQTQIYEDSLKLAEQQLIETEDMVQVGKLAEVELVASQSEVALRKQALIGVQSKYESLRLKLLGLLSPSDVPDFWNTGIVVKDQFVIPEVSLGDIESHVETALKTRPDLNEARLAMESGVLNVVKTKNGLLPYLSFFVTLGNTGYAHTFGQSYGNIYSDDRDLKFGLDYSYNFGQRSEKAGYEQALIKKEQSDIAIENMELTVQEDVRNAWVEIQTAKNKIEAAGATLKLQEEKLRTETEKYRVGRSTSINVSSAQRDLLQSQLDEAQAISDYITALLNLYQSEGTLLGQYGITAI